MNKFIFTLMMMLSLLSGLKAQSYNATGLASYYADKFEGRQTANGEIYSHSKLTAAHPSLPFGTILKVTNLKNGKSVVVRVNDRGPFVKGRIIDLSKSAAIQIDAVRDGLVVRSQNTISYFTSLFPFCTVKIFQRSYGYASKFCLAE